MGTVQTFVDRVLVHIGVCDAGETPASSERDQALAYLNSMIGSLSAAGLFIPKSTRELLSLTGAASYTIGSGATFNTARPLKIKAAAVVSGTVVRVLEIVTSEQWVQIADKSRAGKFARYLFCDGAYPQSTIHLTPTPANGGSLELHSLKPLSEYANLSDTLDLPPGYDLALDFALSKILCTPFGRPLTAEIASGAQDAQSAIAGLNTAVLGAPVAPEAPQS